MRFHRRTDSQVCANREYAARRHHDATEGKQRDDFDDAVYRSAGIPCLHIPAARDYQPQELAKQIAEVTAGRQ